MSDGSTPTEVSKGKSRKCCIITSVIIAIVVIAVAVFVAMQFVGGDGKGGKGMMEKRDEIRDKREGMRGDDGANGAADDSQA